MPRKIRSFPSAQNPGLWPRDCNGPEADSLAASEMRRNSPVQRQSETTEAAVKPAVAIRHLPRRSCGVFCRGRPRKWSNFEPILAAGFSSFPATRWRRQRLTSEPRQVLIESGGLREASRFLCNAGLDHGARSLRSALPPTLPAWCISPAGTTAPSWICGAIRGSHESRVKQQRWRWRGLARMSRKYSQD
jgi:hypothetical protein